MPVYFFALIAIALVPDLVIYFTQIRSCPLWVYIVYWLPLAALVVLMVPFATTLNQTYMRWMFIVFILTVVPKIVFALFALLHPGVGLGVAAITLVGIFIGVVWGWRHVVVREVEVVSPRLPAAFDGYRIVQLSDLHVSTYHLSPRVVRNIVERVNSLQPDLIAFVGDLVNNAPEEVAPFIAQLSSLKAADGVYTVMGNHDYCMYQRYDSPTEQAENIARLQAVEREMGWQMLLNEHRLLTRSGDTIALIGVENDGNPPFPQRGDLRKATEGLSHSIYKVLMSHDPTHWRRCVLPETDIDLMLAGHTHAMQFRIGNFSPSAWSYKEWGGLYREGKRMVNVCTGTGSNVHFPRGAWPVIVVLTLKPE